MPFYLFKFNLLKLTSLINSFFDTSIMIHKFANNGSIFNLSDILNLLSLNRVFKFIFHLKSILAGLALNLQSVSFYFQSLYFISPSNINDF